jgi:hypothetical protein
LDEICITVFANDSGGDISKQSLNNTIPNSRPRTFDVSPSNDAIISSDSVELKARVEDGDGENMEVKFIDETGSRGPVTRTGVNPGDEVSATWNNLDQLKTYYWRLNVSDGHQTTSIRYRFRNQFPDQFRVNAQFETPYASILVSPDTSRVVRYSVMNDASTTRSNLVTTVYGLNSNISATGSQSSASYDLSPGERKFFNIEVSPDAEGTHQLVVATRSNNYNVNTTERIDVHAEERPGAVAKVPGVGLLQLLTVLAFSTLFYSVRL